MRKFIFVANAALGQGLSGSDRIFIELAKRWSKSGNQIEICVWEDGYNMCEREGLTENLPSIKFHKWYIGSFKNLPFILNYIFRIFSGIFYSLTRKCDTNHETYIYSCSDFWQDALPSAILKLKYPQSKLIGSFYLTAPNPFVGYYEGQRKQIPTLKSVLYWLQQQLIVLIFSNLADIMFVTSEPDAKKFKNSIVIRGGVTIESAKTYSPSFSVEDKTYDAVFLGRFHPQKGVLELVDIWQKVVQKKPNAKLIMLGDGPLRSEVEQKIHNNNLQNNIQLRGFVFDGPEKFEIFKTSKLVVHPAIYDSGGMASAEAMAWGIPGVSFDLEALKTYYPKGMVKVEFDDKQAFADKIIELIDNPEYYKIVAQEARSLVLEEWDWEVRSREILNQIQNQ